MRKISNGNIFKIIIISAFDSENFQNTGFGFGPFLQIVKESVPNLSDEKGKAFCHVELTSYLI